MTDVRTGQAPDRLSPEQLGERFRARFVVPAFDAEREAVARRVDAGAKSQLDRHVGCHEPYATRHDTLDADTAVQEEVRNAARAVVQAVRPLREGRLVQADAVLRAPRPK